jgi:hypothetical protein
MTDRSELRLLSEGRVVLTARIDTYCGKRNIQKIHADAAYLSDPQFRVFPATDGCWNIEHAATAKNETIVDGHPLRGRMALNNGATISVGKSSKGIHKFPLLCSISECSERPGRPVTFDAHPPVLVEPPVSNRWDRFIDGTRAKFREIDWNRSGKSSLSWLGTALRFMGTVIGAVLSGFLRGAGSSSSGHTRVRRGNSLFGEVILTIDGAKIRSGDSIFGSVVMTIDGNQIRAGDSIFGNVLATLDGESIREGSSIFGTTLATINGNTVHEGSSMFGSAIATIDGGGRMAGAAAAVFLLRM